MSNGKWKYSYGMHQGTMMSRDMGEPKYFDTEQECRDYHVKNKAWLRRLHYRIWYAQNTSPDGKKTEIDSEPYN